MRLVEIMPLENGAHGNQTVYSPVARIPDGWAVIPDDMVTENFPFGIVDAIDIDGVMTVIKWIPGTIPEPEPTPEPELLPTIDERVTELEEALYQTDEAAIELYESLAAQEEVNAAQDEALIELYEMIGG